MLAAWLAIAAGTARAEPTFLEPEQAFQLTVAPGSAAGEVRLEWAIAPGYYLYRDRLTVALQATPAFAWRDAKGAVQTRTGAPPAAMAQILGPR